MSTYVTETLQNEGGHPLRSSVPPENNLSLATESYQNGEIIPDFSPDGPATEFVRTILSVPSTASTKIPEIPAPVSATVGNVTGKGKKRKAIPSGQKDYPAAAKKPRIEEVILPGQRARMSSR